MLHRCVAYSKGVLGLVLMGVVRGRRNGLSLPSMGESAPFLGRAALGV